MVRQFGEVLLAIALAPLFVGWIAQCRAWLQSRTAPPLVQPYRMMRKLFQKDVALAANATPLFRITPYVLFGSMVLAAAIIPSIATDLPFARVADAIALIGIFATARVFQSLAAMDTGTAFGTMGARREMMVGFLAEPALLMVLFNAFLLSGSTALPSVVEAYSAGPLSINPSLTFAGVAFVMVLLAENARIPIDNPSTHLELTMIHEAMVLEYGGRDLALVELGKGVRFVLLTGLLLAVALPWGMALELSVLALLVGIALLLAKLLAATWAVGQLETRVAKWRLFRLTDLATLAVTLAFGSLALTYLVGVGS